jgi:hypothetical protein
MNAWISRLAILLLAWGTAPAPAQPFTYAGTDDEVVAILAQDADPITYHDAGDEAVAILRVDAERMAEAFRQYIRIHDPDINAKIRNKVVAKANGATIAHFKYQPPGPREPIDIYSRSGRSMKGTMEQLTGTQAESGSSTEAGEEVSAGEEATDAAEAIYYPDDTPTLFRATNMVKRDGWVVRPSVRPGRTGIISGGDAELKALRKLESLFEASPELRGGELTAHVSQIVCESCHSAFNDFAEAYDVKGKVFEFKPDTQANVGLREARKEVASSRLSKAALSNHAPLEWEAPNAASRATAAEAGTLPESELCD